MLTRTDRRVAESLKRRLLEAGAPLLELRVYGSRARGDHRADSDLDVWLLLADVDDTLRQRVSDLAWEVGFASKRVITTVEFTRDEIENTPLRASPFVAAVLREGIVL
jgi:predicted nucleotidyltransferase